MDGPLHLPERNLSLNFPELTRGAALGRADLLLLARRSAIGLGGQGSRPRPQREETVSITLCRDHPADSDTLLPGITSLARSSRQVQSTPSPRRKDHGCPGPNGLLVSVVPVHCERCSGLPGPGRS